MTTVLVASGGGHLQQLAGLAPRLGLTSDVIWATPRSGLSDHLLKDQQYFELPYSAPRDWVAALRLTRIALAMLRDCHASRIISTGASPAPPFFLAGALLGLPMHYIESATRSEGPSLSGRLVAKLPSAHLYTQYPGWASKRWHYAGSIFDPYSAAEEVTSNQQISRVVVTLGTEAYGFRRAVEKLREVLPPGAEVLWQTGHTDVEGLGIEGRPVVPGGELRDAIAEADLVVSHAGTGSALTSFDEGKVPLILPRESRHREHVDDHQKLTAHELQRRGLAISVPVDELGEEHLYRPRSARVVKAGHIDPFRLEEDHGAARTHLVDLRAFPHQRTEQPAESHTPPGGPEITIPPPRASGATMRQPETQGP